MSTSTFGLAFVGGGITAQPSMAVDLAQGAEALGFTALWMPEHVVIPTQMRSPYPYSPDGTPPPGLDGDAPDPLLWLTYVAARTTTIRLCTGVLVLAQRDPLIVAKQAATLDVLSGGRATLGVGVGWLAEEFAALRADFHRRGLLTDEYLGALRALWGEQPASFHGRTINFDHCVSRPRPVQPGGIPIVIGGDSARAARRAGELGDGWFPGAAVPDRLAPLVDQMREAATATGRDPDAIALTTSFTTNPAKREALEQLGFRHFTIGLPAHRITDASSLDTELQGLARMAGLA